jgi:hypothetical protein
MTYPKYGQPAADEPTEYASRRGWYRDHNGHWKFRDYGPAGPGRVYPFPESLLPDVDTLTRHYVLGEWCFPFRRTT